MKEQMGTQQISREVDTLRTKVNVAYSAVADGPQQKHPFPTGRKLAEDLGYPPDLLDTIPQLSVDAFAGVSNVSIFADLLPGISVLDLGCGAGMDSIIAARRVGSTGRVTGVDFSESMVGRAQTAKQLAGLSQVEFHRGDAEHLPLPNNAVDVALVNGIFNLNPNRKQIFSELFRVLRPGGRAYIAELILAKPLPVNDQVNESNWFA
jgi:arsenite methyltransferase